jgi:hypothetical protein
MPKKITKKSTKPPNEKKQTKKVANKQKEEKAVPEKKKESEIASVSLQSNKPQLGEIEEISKKSEIPKIITYEINNDEETSYILNFEQVKDNLRIKISEKNSFPSNEFENFYSLENLIKIDKWFKIFYNVESLLIELEQLTKNERFSIERKKKDCLSLFIYFPINLLEKIEIPIPLNEINNKDLFLQLISKINEIDSKEKKDFIAIDEKLNNLEHLIQTMEINNSHEEENLKNEKQENINFDEKINQEDGKMNNLEEMKDALKKEIANNIKNTNSNEDEQENEKISHENSYEELKNNDIYLLIDQNQLPFQESTIFSTSEEEKQKEIELIIEWISPSLLNLPNPPKVLRTKLVYKSEIDGDKSSNFHEKCDNLGPTIIIIQTKDGYRYGGYTSVSWERPEQPEFKADQDAFIFSFDTVKKYECLEPEKSITCCNSFGPNFGEGTIFVPDNFQEETNAFYKWPSIYNLSEKGELTFGKNNKIEIKEYEVYAIELNDETNSFEKE